MKAKDAVIQGLITTLVNFRGWGSMFQRVKAEVQRINETMPDATGKEKKS